LVQKEKFMINSRKYIKWIIKILKNNFAVKKILKKRLIKWKFINYHIKIEGISNKVKLNISEFLEYEYYYGKKANEVLCKGNYQIDSYE
jgi:hypothetical protein